MSQAGVVNIGSIPPPPGSVTDLEGQDSVIVAPDGAGIIHVQGSVVAAGSTPFTTSGNAGTHTETWSIQLTQAIAATDATKVGLAAFNSANFTVDTNGFVSAIATTINYTNVTGPTTYTVLTTDYYISCDPSAGAITLNFPNAPTFKQRWIIKDRTGNAATNNITVTTPGGAVTFDGLTSYTMNSNYQAIELLANSTPTYEVY